MAKTHLRTNVYGSERHILIATDVEITAGTLEKVRRLRGVEQAFADRYELRVFIGTCFDVMEVAGAVRDILERIDN